MKKDGEGAFEIKTRTSIMSQPVELLKIHSLSRPDCKEKGDVILARQEYFFKTFYRF